MGQVKDHSLGSRQRSACAFALAEFLHRHVQIAGGEIRPAFLQKNKFREGAFPQQKVGQPLFSAGANQQVHICRSRPKIHENFAESFAR